MLLVLCAIITQCLFSSLPVIRRDWELKEKDQDEKVGYDSLSIERKKEIQIIFHKSMVLINSIIDDNNNNT